LLGVEAGMWMLSIVVIIYVASGGLRAVAYVDTLQCLLLAFGILVIGVITLNAAGGWTALNEGIAKLTSPEIIPALGTAIDPKRTIEGYSHYIAIPGVIQFVKSGPSAVGGAWTGVMCLTYMFALMGIQSAPAFSMWSFANKNPRPFAPQQVWASSAGIGFILIIFTAIQGLGGHLIGADANALTAGIAKDVMQIGGNIMDTPGKQGMIVPALINLMAGTAPWLVGLLAVCALAAMQSTGAAYMSTAGGMLTRDLYKRYINPEASHTTQKLFGRIGVVIICGLALVVATTSKDALVLLGGLAVAFGFQMWPALIGICYVPWLTRQGITIGLFLGLVAVMMTESIGVSWFGITAWGRWPWTIHSAAWGIFFNAGAAIIISAMTQGGDNREHKNKFHEFLAETASVPAAKQGFKPIAWILTLVWFIFAIGPGAVIGNTIFGNPNDATTWIFSMPSIWAWQIIWWFLGCCMMYMLAYYMNMSTMPEKDIVALVEDIGDVRTARLDLDKP
ncbi:MAG: hypothetical protein OEL85_09045, partial [Desulfobulbaceae bacterium]|nr:hypothetical protein [Desulfobulbaceae bacterium]